MRTILEFFLIIILVVCITIIDGLCSILNLGFLFKRLKRCPQITNKILLLSACELSEKIRNKEITSAEIVEAYICRIKAVNPVINAVMENRFELAIQEAKDIDAMLKETKYSVDELTVKFPLLGIPITVKESISVKGLSHSAGQLEFKDVKASNDADVIRLIKDAGGIILLVSSTPELCLSLETSNKINGVTYNPYDTRRTPGGSSGGEAALLGAGASLIGIGSDLIGSVRLPAAFCGVWGHKPSAGLVSIHGHKPYCVNALDLATFLTIGPLTRYPKDLLLMLKVILKDDVKSSLPSLSKQVSLKDIKIYFLEDDAFYLSRKVETDITLAIQKLINHLKVNCNCQIEKIKFKKFQCTTELVVKRLLALNGFDNLFENSSRGYYTELLRFLIGKSNLGLQYIVIGIVKSICSFLPKYISENCSKEILTIKNDLSELLGVNSVVLIPTHPTAANFHNQTHGKLFDYGYTSIFNAIGFPATQCPVGLNSIGLPIGIQVVAATNNDMLTLTVAEEINNVFGGWIPPNFSIEL